MTKAQKSYHLDIGVPHKINRTTALELVERAAEKAGLIISHIGGFSRVKYPNSIHWHFKRDRREPGLIDATYWQDGPKFWLILRHREPAWVHEMAPVLRDSIRAEIRDLVALLPAGNPANRSDCGAMRQH